MNFSSLRRRVRTSIAMSTEARRPTYARTLWSYVTLGVRSFLSRAVFPTNLHEILFVRFEVGSIFPLGHTEWRKYLWRGGFYSLEPDSSFRPVGASSEETRPRSYSVCTSQDRIETELTFSYILRLFARAEQQQISKTWCRFRPSAAYQICE